MAGTTQVAGADAVSARQQPVTVSVSRKVIPGKESEYEAWLSDISQVAAGFAGHMGVYVLRPSDATRGEYVAIYRFDTYEHALHWEESKERAAWIKKLAPLVEGESVF